MNGAMHFLRVPVVCFFKDTDCRYRYINSYDAKNLKNKEETGFGTGSILTKEILVDDSVRYYQIIKSAVRDEENKIIGIVGTVTDVTSTKLMFER